MPHLTMVDMASRKMAKGFWTKSGAVSQAGRDKAEKHGDAMPGGRFPIRNKSDLSNAKHAFGRAKDKPKVRAWINKRAKELGAAPMGGGEKKKSRRSAMYDHPRSVRD
jgi:hypothetical protein